MTDGDVVVLVVAIVAVAAALGASYLIVPPDARNVVLPIVLLATLVRVASAVVLFDGLVALGRNGFVTGDDAGYADLSSRLARILHGESAPFDYTSESYLLGTFVYLETALFYVFGPKVLIVELFNSAMGGVLVAFAFDIARRLFLDIRAGVIAAVLLALYPSVALWSALNLKDSLGLVLMGAVLWLLVLFQARPRWWLIPLSFAVLVLLQSVRNYIFVGFTLIIPISVALTTRLNERQRVMMTAFSVALSLVWLWAGARPLVDLDAQRLAMGVNANTNFGDQPLFIRLGYVLFAPFPWSLRRPLDILTVPEMFVWYAALIGALWVVVRRVRLWRCLAPLLLFVGGTLFVFLLAEGNVGTLFRHRAMVIPFVLILAAPALGLVLSRSPRPLRAAWARNESRTGGP